MTHNQQHVIIHKLKDAVNKPVTCKRWHLAALLVVGLVLGLLF
jgi:hypothetical protein